MYRKRPVKFIWAITTYDGRYLQETLDSIPRDQERVVLDSRANGWSVAKAWNHALKKYSKKYDAVIIANDDIRVREDTGIVLSKSLLNLGDQFGCLMTTAYDSSRQGGDQKIYWLDAQQVSPGMFCFCVTRKLVDEIGYFDERFSPALFEDTDMLHRIYNAGKGVRVVAPVFHHGHASLDAINHDAIFAENYRRFVDKWRDEPGYLSQEIIEKWGSKPSEQLYQSVGDLRAGGALAERGS